MPNDQPAEVTPFRRVLPQVSKLIGNQAKGDPKKFRGQIQSSRPTCDGLPTKNQTKT